MLRDTGIPNDWQLREYISLAADSVLTERQYAIADMRFGLTDGDTHTLAEIGVRFGVTRERIRQILNRSSGRIHFAGRRNIRQGKLDAPSALLLQYIEEAIRPGQAGEIDRLFAFVRDEPASVRVLVLQLLGISKAKASEHMIALRSMDRACRAAMLEDLRALRATEAFRAFLNVTIAWPRTTRVLGAVPPLRRCRDVSETGAGYSGSFTSVKLGREVQFESNLERDFLLKLEASPDVVVYQEQPFVLDYTLDGQQRRYYPDFFFLLTNGRGVVVEIKPRDRFALHANLVRWTALRRFCESEGYGLLVTDGRRPIQGFVRRAVPVAYEDAMCAALARGPLGWPECKHIRDRHNAALDDFVAMVLKRRLVWSLHPFTLQQP